MSDVADYQDLLAKICVEWGKAENDVKAAEQVCQEVVYPSIMELRYAGRRLAQALEVISAKKDPEAARNLLHDAWFNCHRARHDAIDAATSQIAITVKAATDSLKHHAVVTAFPELTQLVLAIQAVEEKIRLSRESQEQRDALYEEAEDFDFPNLLTLFRRFQASEPVMKSIADGNRRERSLGRWGLFAGVIAVILALAFGINDLARHNELPFQKHTSSPEPE